MIFKDDDVDHIDPRDRTESEELLAEERIQRVDKPPYESGKIDIVRGESELKHYIDDNFTSNLWDSLLSRQEELDAKGEEAYFRLMVQPVSGIQ